MAAFAALPALRGAPPSVRARTACPLRAPLQACAASNGAPPPASGPCGTTGKDAYLGRAIDAGADMRAQLAEAARERRESAERTQRRIDEMNAALDSIMAKISEQTGGGAPAAPVRTTRSAVRAPAPAEVATPSASSVADIDDDEDDSEPYTDPAMFGLDSTAGWQVLADSDSLPMRDGAPVEFRIECDGSACSLIATGDAGPGPGVRAQWVHSGRGFRVGFDPDAPERFCGMVGTDTWLLALDVQEMRHFKRLCLALANKMARIERGDERPPTRAKPAMRRSGDGMFNERVALDGSQCSVELESKLMWVQANGSPRLGQYAIRVIFMERRQSEGYWAPEVVPGLLAAVAKLAVD